MQFCYESELQRTHDLTGRVVINWLVGLDGRVVNTHVVESSLGSPRVERCMLKRIRTWKFNAPDGGMCSVNFPFVFKGGL